MNISNLWDAISKIDDVLINDAMEEKKTSNSIPYHWFVGAAAIIILIAVSFSTAYTVNAEFREWVISLFQVETTEIVPDSKQSENPNTELPAVTNIPTDNDHITLYATDTIEDVFAVQYLKSDNYLSTLGSLFYYSDGLDNIQYYTAVDNEYVPVEAQTVKGQVSILGITHAIEYTCIAYEDKLYIQNNNTTRFMIDDDNDALFTLNIFDGNEVWLTLYINPQSDKWEYPARYDLETGRTTDILQGIYVNDIELSQYPVLRSWNYLGKGQFVVSLGQTLDSTETYLLDTDHKKAISLSELTGLSTVSSAKIVEDKILLLEPLSEDTFNYYCYDYSKDELIQIYNSALYWNSTKTSDTNLRVKFSGGRYDFIKENGAIYLADEFTGTRLTVEGITEELAESLLINSDNNKILVSSFGENVIRQIGVIDLEAGTLYLLNRENQPGVHEYSIGWNDADHIIINAAVDNSNMSHVYLYSLN